MTMTLSNSGIKKIFSAVGNLEKKMIIPYQECIGNQCSDHDDEPDEVIWFPAGVV